METSSEQSRIRAELARRVTEKFGAGRAVAVAGELDRTADVIWRVRQLRLAAFEPLDPKRGEQ